MSSVTLVECAYGQALYHNGKFHHSDNNICAYDMIKSLDAIKEPISYFDYIFIPDDKVNTSIEYHGEWPEYLEHVEIK